MNPSEDRGSSTWQWVIGAIILIAIIIFIVVTWRSKKETTVTPEGVVNSAQILSERIVVTDQFPGNIVYVSSVELGEPGFVAIYDDSNGAPGKLLGSTYFEKGITPGNIMLTSPTIDGKTYYAVLYRDNGDKTFNPTTDLIAKDAQGTNIIKSFKANANVDESKG